MPRRKAALGDPLSDAELKAIALAAEGLDNPEIAAALWLSIHTVKAQMRMINLKLGASNRTQAVLIALSRRLIGKPAFLDGGAS